jgi:hypothetical protein
VGVLAHGLLAQLIHPKVTSMSNDPSNKPSPLAMRVPRWRRIAAGTVLVACLALFIIVVAVVGKSSEDRVRPTGPDLEAPVQGAPPDPSFAGTTLQLSRTTFLPTLETPLEESKSAIWCATLPLAWKQLEKDLVKGPIDLAGAEELSKALSQSPDPGLEPKDYYVAAGWIRDGIVERIGRELPAKFPKAPLPEVDARDDWRALVYAYLEIAIPYTYQFNHHEEGLTFRDSQGKETEVHAFGIREQDKNGGHYSYRAQVRVLFRDREEFAIDLSQKTKSYQIVLARMNRRPTLRATLDDLDARIAGSGSVKPNLSDVAILFVPSMNWRIDHHYRELEGKFLKNAGLSDHFVDKAQQWVQFKMDRTGTTISSGALGALGVNGHQPDLDPNHFRFDQPYLIVLKKRGGQQPFFVMWVDNAELLQRH